MYRQLFHPDIEELLLWEPVSRGFLDEHLKYVRITEINQLQFDNAHGDKYFYDIDGVSNGKQLYEFSFKIKNTKNNE